MICISDWYVHGWGLNEFRTEHLRIHIGMEVISAIIGVDDFPLCV